MVIIKNDVTSGGNIFRADSGKVPVVITDGLIEIVDVITQGNTGSDTTYTYETQCATILFAKAQEGTVQLAPTIGSSSAYTGTKTVSFTFPHGDHATACYVQIIGTNGNVILTTGGSAATTVTVDNVGQYT